MQLDRVGNTTDILGEGPVWDVQDQALYWVDIRGPALRRLDAASGEVATWPMPEMIGSLAVRRQGGLLLALRSALASFDPVSGAIEPIAAPEAHLEAHRFNDGKCDRQGRFWAGTMHDVTRDPVGTLYRLDAGHRCVAMERGIRIPNSLCWSPDGALMYFADSLSRTIFAYPFDVATGELGARRVFATIEPPAIPDGATVDREGFVWCAHYDGWRIVRFSPDGRIDRTLELPVQRPTSCQFGGPALRTLYITTASQKLSREELARQPLAGALLALETDVMGLPEARYAG
jgi:sugar lactone lactonase YvrE